VLKIVKKHDKRFLKAQIARTMVPTMLSMAFLQMKGLQRIWGGLVGTGVYGLQPLEPMSERVDEMLGAEVEDDSEDEKKDKEGGEKKEKTPKKQPSTGGDAASGGSQHESEPSVDSNKYHMEVVESNQSTLAMDSKRMKTDFVSYVDQATKNKEIKATRSASSSLPLEAIASEGALRSTYVLTETVLGEGSFGKVYLSRHRDPTAALRAEQQAAHVGGDNNEGHLAAKVIPCKDIDQIGAELVSLRACQGSPYVVALDGDGIYHYKGAQYVVIMTELCTKELYDVVVSEAPMPQGKSHHFFIGLMEGIKHIHACGYCHRDIKLENILLLGTVVKICDFGFAAPHSEPNGTPITMNRQCGSLVYASPQSYRGENYMGCAADIWSCAVVLYVMLCGEFPFGRPDGRHCKRYKMHESNRSVFGYLSAPEDTALVQLMVGMLQINTAERWTIDQVMGHPWTTQGCQAKSERCGLEVSEQGQKGWEDDQQYQQQQEGITLAEGKQAVQQDAKAGAQQGAKAGCGIM